MTNKIFPTAALIVAATAFACGGKDDMITPPPMGETIAVSANLTADTTWTHENVYHLTTHIFVVGGTLTIEPGTKIIGDAGSSLVITKNGRLIANGEAATPIVFSSAKPEGQRAAGDWGGVVLLGKAPINVNGGVENIEGFPAGEMLTEYGGSDASHDCGSLKYVRIEFAGFELAVDNELNSLTIGGCGSRTAIDFVQTHKGADDGVEIFGGTVAIRHVVITQPDDDGLDWDFGWSGSAQFMFIQQNALVGNYGIEADNNKNDNDAAPRSSPQIWNATLVGSDAEPGTAGKLQQAVLFRRGTAGKLMNSIIAHFSDGSIDVGDASTAAQAGAGALAIEHNVFFDNKNMDALTNEAEDNDGNFDEASSFSSATLANRFMDPRLTDMSDMLAPNAMPMSGSPVMNGGATPPNGMDGQATFVGAFGTSNWMDGWTAFPTE